MSELRKCTKCGLPETYETIEYGEHSVCSICHSPKYKEEIDWATRKKKLDGIIEHFRGKNDYDCIVPFSGGKDSAFQLYYLCTDFSGPPSGRIPSACSRRSGVISSSSRRTGRSSGA